VSSLLAAFRFLTIFPMPGGRGRTEADLAGSVLYFPLVGLVLGGLLAVLAFSLTYAVPPLLTSALLVVAFLAPSGGLHMDGLADTADGFLGSRVRERTLEIMRDSHVGAMGALGIACVLLVKWAALASVAERDLWRVALLTPVAGRAVMVLHLAALPYARPDGLGAVFYGRRHRADAAWAVLALFLTGGLVLGVRGVAVGIASAVVALGMAVVFTRRIGGVTGDTLGALCEITEMVPAMVVAAWGHVTA
jgi:adenosylcobinamide-GDP ribazoletransferase